MEKPTIGQHVIYTDEFGKDHSAVVTQVWNGLNESYGTNLVYVSGDDSQTDQYGRQIIRQTSVVHETQQPAHGRKWREAA